MFLNKLKILVSKKQLVELTVDEGWYSESELKDDLGWSQFCPQNWNIAKELSSNKYNPALSSFAPFLLRTKIDGAKARCMSLGATHYRRILIIISVIFTA